MEKAEQARKNRNRGKRNEKALAKILKASRVGVFGGEDLTDGKYSFEAKSRKQFIGSSWMDQCEKNCKGKIPVVIVHVTGQKHEDDFVIMKLKYWKELLVE